MNYNKRLFVNYTLLVVQEMNNRDIKWKSEYWDEIVDFCWDKKWIRYSIMYNEHNDRYLKQCYYNLQEKYDRGIITKEEWQKIEDLFEEE